MPYRVGLNKVDNTLIQLVGNSPVEPFFSSRLELVDVKARYECWVEVGQLIFIAIIFGYAVYRRNLPMGISSVAGVAAIAVIIAIGINFHPIYLSSTTWMWIVGLYITIASITPVWILLQPRDYLSSICCCRCSARTT